MLRSMVQRGSHSLVTEVEVELVSSGGVAAPAPGFADRTLILEPGRRRRLSARELSEVRRVAERVRAPSPGLLLAAVGVMLALGLAVGVWRDLSLGPGGRAAHVSRR